MKSEVIGINKLIEAKIINKSKSKNINFFRNNFIVYVV